ncbi:BPSS1780 family membrane protein [Ramlibacter sp. MAHUQ-53]|uniref:BPSS1780 family membrane protein n=1 Tax=unclassified Ramlibacter TaxID=2617605 RepID=UPI003638E76F
MKLNVVPPRNGLAWVRAGMRTFMRQPLAMSGLFFMYMAAVMLLSVLPVIGPVVGGMLVPAATLGLMAASAEANKGRFPMPSVLLSAFRAGRQELRAMLVLGAIYAAGSVLASGLAGLLAGPPAEPRPGELDASLMLALALHLPLFLAFWHAPALVHWHGVSPVKSLFFSVVAVLRNFGAHMVYGLGWLAVFLGTGTVFGVLGGLVGGPSLARAVMMPVALLLAAMFSTSIWFSFRDCFEAPDLPPGTPPETSTGGA